MKCIRPGMRRIEMIKNVNAIVNIADSVDMLLASSLGVTFLLSDPVTSMLLARIRQLLSAQFYLTIPQSDVHTGNHIASLKVHSDLPDWTPAKAHTRYGGLTLAIEPLAEKTEVGGH